MRIFFEYTQDDITDLIHADLEKRFGDHFALISSEFEMSVYRDDDTGMKQRFDGVKLEAEFDE